MAKKPPAKPSSVTIPSSLPRLPKRAADAHKGDFGRALLVGGSWGMGGAIALAGMAALRGGAGLVKLAVPDTCLDTVASFEPSYMTLALPSDEYSRIGAAARDVIETAAAEATCIACGPGIDRSDELTELVGWMYRFLPQPMVIDADGLNALAAGDNGLANPGGPRILTPHLGEFRRLAQEPELTVGKAYMAARTIAEEHGIIVVLKGQHTLVTDGKQNYRNTTGNPGMATGGSGDVLTGLITALICQDLAPFEAAVLGVFLHGLAGDLAAQKLGQVSLIARDLIDFLPDAFQRLAAAEPEAG